MLDQPIARVLAFGDELILGRTADTNSAWLAALLGDAGLRVDRLQVAGDRHADGVAALRAAVDGAALVVVTGGLGPTDDDRTRHVLAEVMAVPLAPDATAWRVVTSHWRRLRRGAPPASNRRQALVPRGATVLGNDRGTAPGLLARVGACRVACLPGVPHEMQAMAARLVPRLPRLVPGLCPPAVGELYLAGLGESVAQELIGGLMTERDPQVGISASELGHLCLRVVGGRTEVARRIAALRRALAGHVLPAAGLAPSLVAALARQGATVATAESCSVGLAAAQLGAAPGASRVLREAIVAYHPEVKTRRLGVAPELIAAEGVVSAAVAAAMAEGLRHRTGADLALATTGIAGPGGGTAATPVGTVWIAASWRGRVATRLACLRGSRERIQRRAAAQALALGWELVGAAAPRVRAGVRAGVAG